MNEKNTLTFWIFDLVLLQARWSVSSAKLPFTLSATTNPYMPMNFEALCLMEPHFVSRLFASLSTPHTGMWLLKCWHAHSQKACDFWVLPMMGSCKTWWKIQQSWVSFSWLKFFPFLGLDIATIWLGRTTMSIVDLASKKKILSSRSHACFQSLKGLLLGLSFSIAIMCCSGSVFVTSFVHLTTCHCHLT
jgi:hypothetical protein